MTGDEDMQWFRWWHDAIDDPKLLRLSLPHRWLWLTVCTMASRSPKRGSLYVSMNLPATLSDVSNASRLPEATVKAGMTLFEGDGMAMIHRDEKGAWVLNNWEKRQPARDDNSKYVTNSRRNSQVETDECKARERRDAPNMKGDCKAIERREPPNEKGACKATSASPDTDTDTDTEEIQIQPPKSPKRGTSTDISDKSFEDAKRLVTALYDWLKSQGALPSAKGWYMAQVAVAQRTLVKDRSVEDWIACLEWAKDDDYWQSHLANVQQLGKLVWPQYARRGLSQPRGPRAPRIINEFEE